MELVMNIAFLALAIACLVAVVATVILIIFNIRRSKTTTSMAKEELPRTIRAFMSAKADDKSGSLFVRLIELGFFATVKTNNHGKDFDDKKHLKNFQMNLTPEISSALWQVKAGD
jgi:hypothetical protein